MADDKTRLYAYGILRSKDTLERTIGRKWSGSMTPMTITGFRVVDGYGPRYCIVDLEGKIDDGVLVTGLEGDDWRKLDILEGTSYGHYSRVTFTAPDGEPCEIYLAGKRVREELRKAGADVPTPKESTGRTVRRLERKSGKYQVIKDFFPSAGKSAREIVEDDQDILQGRRHPIFDQPAPEGEPPAGSKWFHTGAKYTETGQLIYSTRKAVSQPSRITPHRVKENGRVFIDGVQELPPGHERKTAIPLVSYGNLCFRQTLEDRLGHVWEGEYRPAWLDGWRITRSWPRYLVPAEGERAHVFLIDGMSEEDLAKIDRTEGVHSNVYRRALVKVNNRLAWAYIAGPIGRARLNSKLVEEKAATSR